MKREHYLLLRSLVKCGTGELWCLLVREIGSHQTFLPLLVVGGFGSSLNMSLCLDFLVVFSANFIAICFLLVFSISRFNSKQPLWEFFPHNPVFFFDNVRYNNFAGPERGKYGHWRGQEYDGQRLEGYRREVLQKDAEVSSNYRWANLSQCYC